MTQSQKNLGRVLIVDDDPDMRALLKNSLEYDGFRCDVAASLGEVREVLGRFSFDAVLLDLYLGEEDGLEAIPVIIAESPFAKVIVMTGYGSVDLAVDAMERGATTFLTKSGDPLQITRELKARLAKPPRSTEESLALLPAELGLIGESQTFRRVIEDITRLRDTDATVLVLGESGTGKELVARAIHRLSVRASGPFEALNCGAIPETLLESELFGHKKGAFTDAKTDRRGVFEACSGGSLLLDEIGEMPLPLQVKLLRVLQEKEIKPLGSVQSIKTDTRVIAATNRDLEAEVRRGAFREDLFFRLSVFPIYLPPLRERREDIAPLVQHFIERFNARYRRQVAMPTGEVMARLVSYDWPGNVRELQNSLERAVVLSRDGRVGLEDVFHRPLRKDPANELDRALAVNTVVYSEAKEEFERTFLRKILAVAKGNISEAARISGRFRSDIYRLMDKYGIDLAEFK